MHRLVAILLIPFFVAGNSFAHSHGTNAHGSLCANRAHIHIGTVAKHGHLHASHGHAHYGHSHDHDHEHRHNHGKSDDHGSNQSRPSKDTQTIPSETSVSHESDVIYVTAAEFIGTTSCRVSFELASCPTVETFVDVLSNSRPNSSHHGPALTSEPPLYLLHAALRL